MSNGLAVVVVVVVMAVVVAAAAAAAELGPAIDLTEAAGVAPKGRGLLLKEVHCPGFSANCRVGGGAKGFDQELELCSDQPIIVFAIL